MNSSVPAVKDGLLALLTAALPEVQVSLGNPYPDRALDTLVIIGPAEGRSRTYTAGMTRAVEDYTLEVVVSVVVPAQESYADAMATAWEIADSVEEACRTWRPTDAWVLPEGASDEEAVDGTFREVRVNLTLGVKANV